jgi:hypothetical protein
MSNFLTDGRLALLAALQADPEIDARVKTWFDFGPGLSRRHALEPAVCPVVSLAPAEGSQAAIANVESEFPQILRLEAATHGQDAAPCEELVALVLEAVSAARESCLGLSPDGLAGVSVRAVTWATHPTEDAARLIWKATLDVELLWRRA